MSYVDIYTCVVNMSRYIQKCFHISTNNNDEKAHAQVLILLKGRRGSEEEVWEKRRPFRIKIIL